MTIHLKTIQQLTLIAALAFIAACGKNGGSPSTISAGSSLENSRRTGAQDTEGRPYTGYSPESELLDLKSQVPINDATIQFASQIERIEIQSVNDTGSSKKALVQIKFQNSKEIATFSGDLNPQGSIYLAKAVEPNSQAQTGLSLFIKCDKLDCDHAQILIQKNSGEIVAGAILRAELRKIQITDSRGINVDKSHPIKTVRFLTTEIIPGRSRFKIAQIEVTGAQPLQVEGDLVETDGECLALQTQSRDSHIGNGCLVGNSEDGEYITIRYRPATRAKLSPNDPIFYIETEPRAQTVATPTTSHQVAPNNCGLQIRAPVNSLLAQIVADCSQKPVQDEINRYRIYKANLASFLSYYGMSLQPAPTGLGQPMKTMMDELKNGGLPLAVGLLTSIESGFSPHAQSPSGAYGWWQLMPATARRFGIIVNASVDQRSDIRLATRAASGYLNYLLKYPKWTGDLKLAFAAYNCGEGCIGRTMSHSGRKGVEDVSLGELATHHRDFWELYKRNLIPKQTKDYVPKAIAAILISVDPNRTNFGDQTPIPAY